MTDTPHHDPDFLRVTPGVGEQVRDDVLRTFSDPAGTRERAASAREAIERFMAGRASDMKTGPLDLREVDASEGINTLRIRYQQYHNGLPVLGSGAQAVADIEQAGVTNVDNTTDGDLAGAPDPARARPFEEVRERVTAVFAGYAGTAQVHRHTLGYVRDDHRPPVPAEDYPTAPAALLATGAAPDGAIHLVYDCGVETGDPYEQFQVVADAVSGDVLWVALRGKYVTADLSVFMPDPVSESDDATLSSASGAAALDGSRHVVQAEIDAAVNGRFALQGDWFRCVDWDTPTFAQPDEPAAAFHYRTHPADRRFLSANAYYWLDTFARYLRGLGHPTLNQNMRRVDVDPQAFDGADNSQWVPGTPPRIRFGEGGVPDAADTGVILHEYLHGVFEFLGSDHGGSLSYEHSFCDAIAAVFRDRTALTRHRRAETFPFDNNATDRWSETRTLDRTERFDDDGFDGFEHNLRNSMLGTAVWQTYLALGGDSADAGRRRDASDAVIKTFLEMLTIVPDSSSQGAEHARSLAEGMISADQRITGGLYGKVMDAAFVARGLWPPRPVDVYIGDSDADTGLIPSPEVHWTSPDIWVRNVSPADGDDPAQGHQTPVVGRPNFLYVRVRNRGTQQAEAGTFTVEAFRCDPGTGMIWPAHFQSLGTLPVADPIPAGGSARVGPFAWTPELAGHECLLAVAHGAADPAVTATLTGPVPHDRLVRYDNNVGQRNVVPQLSVPGGRTKVSLWLRGGTRAGTSTLSVDAGALPSDSTIEIRTAARVVTGAAATGFTGAGGATGSPAGGAAAVLRLRGGGEGRLTGFPLLRDDRVGVEVVIDVSGKAEHLQTYPLVVTQYRDGLAAGRMTIETVAVKETEGFFFGDPETGELHVATCPTWPDLPPERREPFETETGALARGYHGCPHCLPNLAGGSTS
ncbi:hypothetical protein HCN51_31125 [Nonomuraea sp. FMUSA5-5]|uniref:FTP domain-containing protein n=1 Tax=Nonomuraea composti TaxID=2720023 RepID=A0ABX1BBB1_9ACTN|nr:hypothetical protein [Nonomuraea sp. FMUSA5-5]NJP93845.1 hypothetical protein [Nonomuraea sp. FMUSA5-5]